MNKLNGSENLTLLGDTETVYPTSPEEAKLEVIPNMWLDSDYVVNLDCHEFYLSLPEDFSARFCQY